jgi:hypothetical protein
MAGTSADIAPVAALPTTAAHFALWNGEPAGGKTYTITAVGFTCTTSAAAALVQQLLALNTGAVQPLISGTAGKGPRGTDGLGDGTRAAALGAVTLTASQVAGGVWHPVGPSVNGAAATATIGMGSYQLVRGLYTVPPGGLFCLAVLCSAAGSAKNQLYVNWEEA